MEQVEAPRQDAGVKLLKDASQPPLVTELIGWFAFVLFVGTVWKLRRALDRRTAEQ
jgi:hypothetical protein